MKAILVFLIACAISVATAAPNFGNELGALNFEKIVGGPLTAVIKAQALAATTTLEFIDKVAFTGASPGSRTVQNAVFAYNRQGPNGTETFNMTVPFLLMVPIPYIEIDEVTIDFNVKLNSVDTSSSSDSSSQSASLSVGVNWGFGSASLTGSIAHQSQSKQSSTVKKEYSLNVKVHASQAGLPKGAERLLDILETVILSDVKAN